MLWQRLQEQLQLAAIDRDVRDIARPILHVDSQQQTLSFVTPQDNVVQTYSISTSRFGTGQRQGSNQTPLGIHYIAEKIGAQEPAGRVFRARQPTEQICLQEEDGAVEEDVITSRIMWLQGLQAGVNRGGEVDTKQRYIYIHGTTDEAHIGQPASIGCIRMRYLDVISLFDQVEVGDLVIIE